MITTYQTRLLAGSSAMHRPNHGSRFRRLYRLLPLAILLCGLSTLVPKTDAQVCNSIIEAALNNIPGYSPAKLREEYLQGKRHLFFVGGSLLAKGIVAGVDVKVLVDLDDHASRQENPITDEGLEDWVTVWVILEPCLGCVGLPGKIGLLTYDRAPGICGPSNPGACDDPDFTTLAVDSLTVVVGVEIINFSKKSFGEIEGIQPQGLDASASVISGGLQVLKFEMKREDLNCAFAEAFAPLTGPVGVGVAPILLVEYLYGEKGAFWRAIAGEKIVANPATGDNGRHAQPTGTDVLLVSSNPHGSVNRAIGETIPIDLTYFNHGSLAVTAQVAVFDETDSRSQLFDRRSLQIPSENSVSYTIAWNTTLASPGRHVFRFVIEGSNPPEPVLNTGNNVSQIGFFLSAAIPIPPVTTGGSTGGTNVPQNGPLSAGTVGSPIYVGTDARYSIVYWNPTGAAPSRAQVFINGDTVFNLLPGAGSVTSGRQYFKDKSFFSVGSENRYHFEFVVAGKLYRYPESSELSGPVVQSPGDFLVNGSVTPDRGDRSTVFTYSVTFTNPAGFGPTFDTVALFIDGSAQGINMETVKPNDRKWANGVTFTTTIGGLETGNHKYHFSCAFGGTTHNVSWPSSGEQSGPTIGVQNVLSITMTPLDKSNNPVTRYKTGDQVRIGVQITDSNGIPQNASVRFIRADDAYFLKSTDTGEDPMHTSALVTATMCFWITIDRMRRPEFTPTRLTSRRADFQTHLPPKTSLSMSRSKRTRSKSETPWSPQVASFQGWGR